MRVEAYQVKFKQTGETVKHNGILVYNENKPEESIIICSCCGGVYPLYKVDYYEKYPTWVDFSTEI